MIELKAILNRKRFKLDVSFKSEHRVSALFGPSGSGKSTLLSIIAGTIKPDSGLITIDDDCIFDSERNINKPIHKRRIGLLFQDSRLFPHFTVEQNLKYAFNLTPKQEQSFSVSFISQLLEIEFLRKQRPHELSGGEKQRVALGRVLLSSPRLLLLDEPLASLDERLKSQILPFLKLVVEEINVPMLYVSHSKDEIMQLTNSIINIKNGKILT